MAITKINTIAVASLSIIGVLFAVIIIQATGYAQTSLPSRSLQIADPKPAQTNVNYTVGFSVTGAGYVLGSFTLLFCDNTPLIGQPCDPPVGFDASTAIITNQTGISGFTIAPGATANSLLLTRVPTFVNAADIRIELSGITNPTNKGTYFGRIQTYSSDDATGVAVNEGGVTFAITPPIDIATYVPPYLYLCVAVTLPGYLCSGAVGNFVDFGELSANQTRTGTSQFLVATNAGAGFVVYVIGIPPTSGNNVIPAMTTRGPSQTGVSQFGINLRDNSNPDVGNDPVGAGSGTIAPDYNIPNQFKFFYGQALVSSNTTTADKKFTTSYIINVNRNQKPGVYNTTLLYIALATF